MQEIFIINLSLRNYFLKAMPQLTEIKILPYKAEEMNDLVMDIENYSQFLPWCKKSRIVKHISDDNLHADLVIHFKAFNERYRSDVRFHKEGESFIVESKAISGPFKDLFSRWEITPISCEGGEESQSCEVKFFLSFKFNSFFLEKMIGAIFEKAAHKMISSFQDRADKLFG